MRRGSDDVARVGRHVPRTRDRETELEHHLENVTKKQLDHVFTRVRIDEPIFSSGECVLLKKYRRRLWV